MVAKVGREVHQVKWFGFLVDFFETIIKKNSLSCLLSFIKHTLTKKMDIRKFTVPINNTQSEERQWVQEREDAEEMAHTEKGVEEHALPPAQGNQPMPWAAIPPLMAPADGEPKKKRAGKGAKGGGKRAKYNPLGAGTKYMQQKAAEKALKRHLQSSPTMAPLYEVYKSIEGHYEQPIVCIENQCDQQHSNYVQNDMTRISHRSGEVIFNYDQKHEEERQREAMAMGATAETLSLRRREQPFFAQRKWLMQRGTNPNDRPAHKRESQKRGTHVMNNYTNCAGVRAAWDDARAKGLGTHIHDMTDAFLQIMQALLLLYQIYAQSVLGNRRPGQVRSEFPILTPEQMHGGGTLRGIGIDPGINALGLCIVELGWMVAPPEDRADTPIIQGYEWAPRQHPEPVFRILLMELVDLTAPWSDTHGYAQVSYRPNPHPGEWMFPDYLTQYPKIEHLFAAQRKRKKPGDKETTTTTTTKKRLKRLDGTPVAVSTLIDLTCEDEAPVVSSANVEDSMNVVPQEEPLPGVIIASRIRPIFGDDDDDDLVLEDAVDVDEKGRG